METKPLYRFDYFTVSLLIFIFLIINNSNSHEDHNIKNDVTKDSGTDYILCRICGADLADSKNIINHLSPFAKVIVNQTLFKQSKVEVQLLKNAVGIEFKSITLLISNCAAVNNWHQEFSWYPGYVWKPCICEQCKTHHGWVFEPIETVTRDSFIISSDKRFFVLKLYNLLSEQFANSLIVIPKSYMN